MASNIEKPSEAIVDTWIALMGAQHKLLGSIENIFKSKELPPLSWYDVLWELERGNQQGLRPVELEQRLLLPQYSLSRLLVRIERAGYIQRQPCDNDGRGYLVSITKAGRQMRGKIWRSYSEALSTLIGEKLTDSEAKTLSELLNRFNTAKHDH